MIVERKARMKAERGEAIEVGVVDARRSRAMMGQHKPRVLKTERRGRVHCLEGDVSFEAYVWQPRFQIFWCG